MIGCSHCRVSSLATGTLTIIQEHQVNEGEQHDTNNSMKKHSNDNSQKHVRSSHKRDTATGKTAHRQSTAHRVKRFQNAMNPVFRRVLQARSLAAAGMGGGNGGGGADNVSNNNNNNEGGDGYSSRVPQYRLCSSSHRVVSTIFCNFATPHRINLFDLYG